MDLTALTVPVFVGVWGLGWGSCYAILVKPMQDRLSRMETKLSAIEVAKDHRIAALEKKIGLSGGE